MLNILPGAKHEVPMLKVFVLNKKKLGASTAKEGMPPPHALFGHASVSCCFLNRTVGERACFLYLFEPQLRTWTRAVFPKCLCILCMPTVTSESLERPLINTKKCVPPVLYWI